MSLAAGVTQSLSTADLSSAMPHNPRQQIKQTMQSALNEIQKAMDKLTTAGQPYQEPHPDYYQCFCDAVRSLADIKAYVEELSSKI